MDIRGWLILFIMIPAILGPLARIWEQGQPERQLCPPCLVPGSLRPMGGGTCGSPPRVNALCPRCGKYWHSSSMPEVPWTWSAMSHALPVRVPTVFNDPWVGALDINPDFVFGPAR